MSLTKQDTLRVPGASLSYEVRGEGPLLLLIAGGSGGGGGFTGIADHLADQYNVVTYDRRGFGNSTLDDPRVDVSVQMHSDDAHALLAALTREPASVFGSSAGALIGLDLVIRYPQQVRLLVAHEPAAPGLVPAFDQAQERHLETYQREGALAALKQIATETGVTYEEREPGVELPPITMQSAAANAEALFKYTVPAVRCYRLDITALAAAPVKIVLASGSAERASQVSHCTVALAERLGTAVVAFPSHHTGYISHPRAFAQRLREVLGEEAGK